MRYLYLLLILTFPFGLIGQNLPHTMTADEQLAFPEYIKAKHALQNRTAVPPSGPVRTMAEWEKCQGTVITWTGFTDILRQITDYAQEEGKVFIICSDSNTVKNSLTSYSIPLTNVEYLETGYNSIWCRDYGPWSVYLSDVDSLMLVDWTYNRPRPLDDATPSFIADYLGIPRIDMETGNQELIHTGGNFMVDGHGTGFSSELTINENPTLTLSQIETRMMDNMGIDRYIIMPTLPYDVIHHIDMHLKLLDEETILAGEYPVGVADGPQIEANVQYIQNNYTTCFGRPYKIVRIPMPPDANGNYPDNNGDYRTYTNSLLINGSVIVPAYEEQYDTTAERIYREAMPGYAIHQIDCNSIIPSLGTIHCITKEIGEVDPLWISHAPLQNTNNTTTPYDVVAKIKHISGINTTTLYWSTDTATGYTPVVMTSIGNDSFSASIPAQVNGTTVFYYVSATAISGKSASKPLVAPAGFFKFTVDQSTSISSTQTKTDHIYPCYPNPFQAAVRFSFQLWAPETVEITLFDLSGKEIAKPVSGNYPEGYHYIDFDGMQLAKGVYVAKIQTNSGVSYQKLFRQ